MHDTGCLGLVHWDDPEGWYREGGGRRVQEGCFLDDQVKIVTDWLGSSDSLHYLPDIAPLVFHLFQSLQKKIFNSVDDCKRHLKQFFAQKDKVLRR